MIPRLMRRLPFNVEVPVTTRVPAERLVVEALFKVVCPVALSVTMLAVPVA